MSAEDTVESELEDPWDMMLGETDTENDEAMKLPKYEDTIEMVPYKAVFHEIVDDFLYDMCLKVHKAVKLDYFLSEEYVLEDENFVLSSCDENGIFQCEDPFALNYSIKKSMLWCPSCRFAKGASKFSRHLTKCMPLNQINNEDNSKVPRFGRKRYDYFKAIENVKKGSVVSLDNLTTEQRTELFETKCCVPSKKTGLYCKRSLNCPTHTEKEKKEIRQQYEKKPDPKASEGETPVDG